MVKAMAPLAILAVIVLGFAVVVLPRLHPAPAPDLPEPAIVRHVQVAVDVAGEVGSAIVESAIDTLGAEGHAAARHGAAVRAIFEALQAGSCTARVYVQDPECDPGRARSGQFVDGQKGYAVCNVDGKLGLVPILYDALSGQWRAMTAFYADQPYLDGVLARDKCTNLLDLSRICVVISFQELLEEEP